LRRPPLALAMRVRARRVCLGDAAGPAATSHADEEEGGREGEGGRA